MSGVNKVIILGNLGNDPDVKYMPNGDAVVNLSVATSETWKDKQSGEKREKTEWHRIVIFRKLGEIAANYLKKGSKVYLEGKLQTRKWQGQDGTDRYTTEIVANQMQMLDRKPEGNEEQTYQKQANQNAKQQQQHQQVTSGSFDDDIPF